jgi:hypothetical protein
MRNIQTECEIIMTLADRTHITSCNMNRNLLYDTEDKAKPSGRSLLCLFNSQENLPW